MKKNVDDLGRQLDTLQYKMQQLEEKAIKPEDLLSLDRESEQENSKGEEVPDDEIEQPVEEEESNLVAEPIDTIIGSEEVSKEQTSSTKKPKRESRTRTEWELLIGGKWLNWIGAVALFLGAAFFMKYAFDNNWINEVTRVFVGSVFGLLVLFFGNRFSKKGLAIFSQGLIGTGLAVLYTAVFASYNFYHLIPQWTAILIMLLVAVLGFQQASKFQSLPIALIGWIGAYGTPFVLPGGGSMIGLMSYLGLVTVGILALVWKKRSWNVLYYLSFVATYFIFFGWSFATDVGKDSYVLLLSLSVFWALFYLFDLRFLFHVKATKYEKMIGIINTLCLICGLYIHFPYTDHFRIMLGSCLLFIAILYLIPILVFYYRKLLSKTNQWQMARQSITFLSCVLLATIVFFTFPASLFVISLEVAFIIWWGLRYEVRYIDRFGLIILGISTYAIFFYTIGEYSQMKPVINWVIVNNFIGVVVLLCSAHWYGLKNLSFIRNSLHVIWSILLFVGIYVEGYLVFLYLFPRDFKANIDFPTPPASESFLHASYLADLCLILLLLVYSVLLTGFGLKRKVMSIVVVSSTILAVLLGNLMVTGSSYVPIKLLVSVGNIRVLTFVLTLGLLYVFYLLWKKNGKQHPWYKWYRLSTILLIVVLLFEMVTVEIIDGFAKKIELLAPSGDADPVSYLENLQFYTLVLVWIFGSIPVYLLGTRLRFRVLMYLGLSTLGIGAIPILIKGLSYYSYEKFVPVINLRFLSLLCMIGVVFFFYRYMKKNLSSVTSHYLSYIRQTLFFLGVFAVFLGVTMEINDAFKATMLQLGIPDQEIIRLRNLQQLFISIAWLLLSCLFLWIGIWQKKQSVRILSIGVFGISILKIFLFDLSFLTTLYRIFSFMGLGVILLAVSFVYQKNKHWFSAD
ncbi:DUF2339 domain-containing protein [Shimazuella kribbensis]|uniref:DUF2339 domain-containing protein n=1 Tax=Shimazuella kribbensis TaxID=139808 RepID=UPI00147149B9|nr:DUF2339 domain-containing protein [Shimazuella kribbensis]